MHAFRSVEGEVCTCPMCLTLVRIGQTATDPASSAFFRDRALTELRVFQGRLLDFAGLDKAAQHQPRSAGAPPLVEAKAGPGTALSSPLVEGETKEEQSGSPVKKEEAEPAKERSRSLKKSKKKRSVRRVDLGASVTARSIAGAVLNPSGLRSNGSQTGVQQEPSPEDIAKEAEVEETEGLECYEDLDSRGEWSFCPHPEEWTTMLVVPSAAVLQEGGDRDEEKKDKKRDKESVSSDSQGKPKPSKKKKKGRKERLKCKPTKTTQALFNLTGMDPKAGVRKRFLKKAMRKIRKKKSKQSGRSEGLRVRQEEALHPASPAVSTKGRLWQEETLSRGSEGACRRFPRVLTTSRTRCWTSRDSLGMWRGRYCLLSACCTSRATCRGR